MGKQENKKTRKIKYPPLTGGQHRYFLEFQSFGTPSLRKQENRKTVKFKYTPSPPAGGHKHDFPLVFLNFKVSDLPVPRKVRKSEKRKTGK